MVSPQKTRTEFLRDPKHVMNDQHLPVNLGTPTWLIFYLSPGPLILAPPVFPFCPPETPLIPPLDLGIVAVFAGPSGLLPGTPVNIPLSPLPPGIAVRVSTIGFILDSCLFVTDGVSIETGS